jgi:hypothetical protein
MVATPASVSGTPAPPSSVVLAPVYAMAWSSSDRPSRRLPSAAFDNWRIAPCSAGMPSASRIFAICPWIWLSSRRLRLNCRQRDSTVTGSFCGSVVASRNFTWPGGSSSVFSSALNADFESMWTSSIR